jgi:alkylation response protein AidB-like acyl-CoA dehydrogenase
VKKSLLFVVSIAHRQHMFGDQVVYGDPAWYQGSNSPYYAESHKQWRVKCREFIEKHIIPHVSDWEKEKAIPRSVAMALGDAGLLQCVAGKNSYSFTPKIKPPLGFDYFHELIFIDELARSASGGVLWGLIEGLQIGLPPILNFASRELQAKIAAPCLMGKEAICLCITEPTAGSDVAAIKTTAVRSGDFYIVNGEKKWITNGIFADWFTVAVKTGDLPSSAASAISLLMIHKSMPGVKTRRMDCQGVHSSGTTYIEFENVKVPTSNLIGIEGDGFKYIMKNFNHERWGFVVQANRFSRVCLEESIKYALKRKTFGKPLIDHEVIRWKIAEMIRQIESTHAWLETITFQMNTLDNAMTILGGPISLLKAHSTKIFEYCAREASQIFGGNSYTKSGMGEKIERLYRDVRAYAIPGGSEEILLDLGVRQAVKRMQALSPKNRDSKL